ncbi:MAG: hypothetical protein HYR71_04550 [Chloroflexi bacterium]|nr:hypothetical protein [Chloroflexota bacterium]
MTTEAATVEQTLAAILADLGSELERTQTELKETELMGGQSRRESETLARRDLQMSNRLRQVEANLEDYSREELREIYNAVRELQMRLFLMRSQVEQLDHKRVTLDRYRQQAQKLMGAIQQLQAITQPPPPPPTPRPRLVVEQPRPSGGSGRAPLQRRSGSGSHGAFSSENGRHRDI